MSQPIKYANTRVDPTQSASEIASLVQRYGGSRFEMRWDDRARLVGIRFAIRHERLGEVPVRLMAAIDNVERIMREREPYSSRMRRSKAQWDKDTTDRAYRIAWRQLKDFVEQSLFAVETGLFPLLDAFMAHVETPDPDTGAPITVGELVAGRGTLERGGIRFLPIPPTTEAEWEIEP